MVQFAAGGGEMGIAAPLGEGRVESGVLGEPFLRTCLGPEGDDFGWGKELDHAAELSARARECTAP